MNMPQMQLVPLRAPAMRSDYLLPAKRDPHFFTRLHPIDMTKNYSLKRETLPDIASLTIRCGSPNRHSDQASDSSASPQKQSAVVNSSRYKTELCRPFEEQGFCKYGDKCQFAHGIHELRNLARHPKYKTELCRTYHTVGFCPYGPRCHFVHNEEDFRTGAQPQQNSQPQSPSSLSTDSAPHALRSLLSSWEYAPFSNAANQLSVSLGSAGDYSPPSSLSTSPVLSPAFSDDNQSPIPVSPLQHLSPVWPTMRLCQELTNRFVQHSTVPQPIPYDQTKFQRALAHCQSSDDYSQASRRPSHQTDLGYVSSEQQQQQCISSEEQSVGASKGSNAARHCPESPIRLPIFRHLSVEEQAVA